MAFTTGNDVNILQASDATTVTAREGDDRYIISGDLIADNQTISITDTLGANTIQLVGGLSITSSSVAADAAQLTLSNGAVITLLGASTFTYQIGGDSLTGTGGASQDYTTFVTTSLGLDSVPAEGETPVDGTAVDVNEDGTVSPGDNNSNGTYTLTAAADSVDEGATATFNLTSVDVAEGTEVAYTISGVDAADVDGGSLTGTVTVAADGTATISVALAADAATEGAETLTVSLDGTTVSASSTVNDTSVAATFTLTADNSTVNEGDTITYTVADADANTTYNYTITGVAAADVSGGSLTGSFTTDSSGAASFSVAVLEDLTTEGTETLTVSVDNTSVTSAVTVTDSSTTPAGTTKSLTTERDIITELTTDDDTVTGDFGTVQAEDIILDSSTTDNDTANLTIGNNVAVTLANIENVNLDLRGGGTVDATNFSGVNTISVDSNYGESTFNITNMVDGAKLVFDSTTNGGTVDVAMYQSGSTEINDDAATVEFTGGVTATLDVQAEGAKDVDALTIESTGSSKNTITMTDGNDFTSGTNDSDSLTVTGTQDLTLVWDQDTTATNLDGATVTNSLTSGTLIHQIGSSAGELEAGEIDLDSVDGVIEIADDTNAATVLKVKSGATVQTSAVNLIDSAIAVTSATSGGTLNFNFKFAENGAGGNNITFNEAATVNIANTGTAALDVSENIVTAFAGVGNTTDVNVEVGNGLTLGTVGAGSDIDVLTVTGATSGADFTVGNITTAGNVTITVDDQVTLDEVISASAGAASLTITADEVSIVDNIGTATDYGSVSVTAAKTIATTATNGTIDSDGTLTLNAGTTLSIGDAANIDVDGNITMTAASTLTNNATVTSNTGNVELTSSAADVVLSDTTAGDIVSTAGNIAISAATSINTADDLAITATAGTVSLVAGTSIASSTTSAITSGTAMTVTAGTTLATAGDLTAGSDLTVSAASMNLGGTSSASAATGTLTLTGSSTTVDSIVSHLTANSIVLDGSGHDFTDNGTAATFTGNVTVKDGVDLTMSNAASDLVGNLTVEGNSTIDIDELSGNLIAGSSTGDITLDSTDTGTTSIVSGSGNDSITTGDIEALINTGSGNDTIAAANASSALNIDAGAGVDTITAGTNTGDIIAGGTGSDTFVYTDITHGGASESITDFTGGSAGDVFKATIAGFNNLTADGATVVKVDTTDSVKTSHDGTDVLLFTGEGYANTAALLTAVNGSSGVDDSGNTGNAAAANDSVLAVYYNTTDSAAYIVNIDDTGSVGDFDAINVAVKLSGVSLSDINNFNADNFTMV